MQSPCDLHSPSVCRITQNQAYARVLAKRNRAARHQPDRVLEMTGSRTSGTSPIDSLKQSPDNGTGLLARRRRIKLLDGGTTTEAALMAARKFGIHHEA